MYENKYFMYINNIKNVKYFLNIFTNLIRKQILLIKIKLFFMWKK